MTNSNEAKATPRPWTIGSHGMIYDSQDNLGGRRLIAHVNDKEPSFSQQANASLIVKAVNNHDTLLFYAKDYLKCLEKKDPNSVTLIEGLRKAIANATK